MTSSACAEATTALTYPIHLQAKQIEYFIPHRAPMLFVQEADILTDDHYRGVACWPADSPVVSGHFRGCPIVPGVCLLEAAAQVSAVGAMAGNPQARASASGRLGMLAGVLKCAFKRPVLPGERVMFDVHMRRIDDTFGSVKAQAFVDEVLVATLEFFVCQVDIAALSGNVAIDELIEHNRDVFGFEHMSDTHVDVAHPRHATATTPL